ASATRYTMPPDNWDGSLSALAASISTSASFVITSSRITSSGSARSSRSGSATLSYTLSAENSAPCWNSTPQRRRISFRSSAAQPCNGRSNTLTVPRLGCPSPSIRRSNIDLPLPDSPIRAITSPDRTQRLISRWMMAAPICVHAPRNSITQWPGMSKAHRGEHHGDRGVHQDHHGDRRNDRVCRAGAQALRIGLDAQPVVARDRSDQDAKQHPLSEAQPQIGDGYGRRQVMQELPVIDAELPIGSQHPADQGNCVAPQDQQRQGDCTGDELWQHQP